ncbi:hypothetical protein [Streptomyces sp. NPDC048825]|uniref:hypothetical protein n=1 Tax=Streptomyces sp. NPDC048825 TaxID=3365592 RepID=UPI003716368C
MAQVRNGDLRISGRLKAGNIAQGYVTITPVANTPTSATVSGLSLAGTGAVIGLCASVTSLPNTDVLESSVSGLSSTGMTVWTYRDNTTDTKVAWLMWRKRT